MPSKRVLFFCLIVAATGCVGTDFNESQSTLFALTDSSHTNIQFKNKLENTFSFNIYRYRNFYNGGGVAIGDINNDGLQDIFFTGNQVSNELYLNKGNFKFKNITKQAGVSGQQAWSTGVSMADVNGDGLIDIYVCNSGIVKNDDRKNELYINNGDLTFDEKAEAYGLADTGFSISAQFLDYDKDGDLDLYVVNNSYREIGSFNPRQNTRGTHHQNGGDRLYRNNLAQKNYELASSNNRISKFTNVTESANIYSSEIGFGLGASVADVNRDGWPDLYISNDFFERDYLYVNNRDGTFREVLTKSMKSISAASMGSDVADLNSDGYPEVFVTEMLPRIENRVKQVTSFDSWDRYTRYVGYGYHNQFTRNTLQWNRTPYFREAHTSIAASLADFSEVGRLSSVESSDWSWGALIADYNLDGSRDIFVSNGIYRDLTNADFLVKMRSREIVNKVLRSDSIDFRRLIHMIPSNPVPNYMFSGEPGLRFTEVGEEWGLAQPSFSNGAAYGDLDNDGDLDLVVNNVNMEAFVYRNRASDLYPDRAWLQVRLEGPSPNTSAIGAQVTAWADGRQWYVEQQPVRGFQSTVGSVLHMGLGAGLPSDRLDSLVVRWPNGSKSTRSKVALNQRLSLRPPRTNEESGGASSSKAASVISKPAQSPHSDLNPAENGGRSAERESPYFEKANPSALGLDWRHRENRYNDFERQPLLFHMKSTEGPPICTGDINGDGRSDIFVGGSAIQSGSVFVQKASGNFRSVAQPALAEDRNSEDTDCAFFDANGDDHLDLYVASGGSEYPASSSDLMDRLYINDGEGTLDRSDQMLLPASGGFEPTGAVAAADYDDDGDVDLFVGARMSPFAFGIPADGHLLINDGDGNFTERTDALAPGLRELGMITDAEWADVDGDGDLDLAVAGEWMPLTIFQSQDDKLVDRTSEMGLEATSGWWNSIEITDLDGDNDPDLIGANHGLNSRFEATPDKPLRMWAGHFDNDGSVEQVIAIHREGDLYPMALRHDLLDAVPTLEDDYPSYKSYAGQTVYQIFSEKQLRSATSHQVQMLESVVAWNEGGSEFRVQQLPRKAQLSPMYDMNATTFDSTAEKKIVMGGNLYEAKPQVGRYDASYGAVMASDSTAIKSLPASRSGFWVNGQVRDIETLPHDQGRLMLVGVNDDSLRVFRY